MIKSLYCLILDDDDAPRICRNYRNENCWNGTANVTVNNVNFDIQTIAGQSQLVAVY